MWMYEPSTLPVSWYAITDLDDCMDSHVESTSSS
jgi:hypothetical protein